jgi:hypothetical protein
MRGSSQAERIALEHMLQRLHTHTHTHTHTHERERERERERETTIWKKLNQKESYTIF